MRAGREGTVCRARVLEELLGDGHALFAEEFADCNRAGGAKHLDEESNRALQGFAVEEGGDRVGGIVQVDDSLPQSGINYAAEITRHLIVGGWSEAQQYVIQRVAYADKRPRERCERLHLSPFLGVGVRVGARALDLVRRRLQSDGFQSLRQPEPPLLVAAHGVV